MISQRRHRALPARVDEDQARRKSVVEAELVGVAGFEQTPFSGGVSRTIVRKPGNVQIDATRRNAEERRVTAR
jgi:hypothetical protein